MEAMNLVEVILNQENEEDNEKAPANSQNTNKSSPIKGLDESITITVTRTPTRPANVQRQSGKPAYFALMSPVKNGRNSDAIRLTPREEMVCGCCQRVFKYKAAFLRHEAQCGLPVALKMERAALIEAKKVEKAAELERRKMEEKLEKEKLPELRCPTCLKQFTENDSFKNHNFQACAAERATYTFVCDVCKARFKYKNHLRRHEDSHNNVRRYNCDVCTTAFLRPDHLKRHMMRMHGIVQLPTQSTPEELIVKPNPGPGAVESSDEKNTNTITKTTPMQCPMCSKILSRRDHVLRHMRNVHHTNYEPRKRGTETDSFLGLEGLMDLDHSNSYQDDDEDRSENQSMTSHDGLLIDESFESVKTERESPISDDCGESAKSTGTLKVVSPSRLFHESYNPDESTRKKLNYPFGQSNLSIHLKAQTPLLDPSVETVFCGNGQKNQVNTLVDENGSETFEKVNCPTSMSFGCVAVKGENGTEEKTGQISRTSDGNQNVLSNGHAAQNVGEDWISDLNAAKYSGW